MPLVETSVSLPPSLPKLEELNAANNIGYEAGRILRDVALHREVPLDQLDRVSVFIFLALRDINQCLEREKCPGLVILEPRHYAPEEVVQRFARGGRFPQKEPTTNLRTLVDQLRETRESLGFYMEQNRQLPSLYALAIYDQLHPLAESYLEEASNTAELVTAM